MRLTIVLVLVLGSGAEARREPVVGTPAPPVKVIIRYVDPPAPPPSPIADYSADLQALWKLVSGDGGLASLFAEYRRGYLAVAMPFFATIVPKDLPRTVVYPFGGGDLVSALAVFPDANDITTISLEPAGEAAAMFLGGRGAAASRMEPVRRHIGFLLRTAFSKTEDMGDLVDSNIPSQILYSLMAMAVHGFEPVSLTYFKVENNGTLRTYTRRDIETELKKGNTRVWDNAEIRFRRGSDERVHRHIYTDLSDKRFARDPALERFLSSKGKVAMMTKACSYLLWEDAFSKIRQYMLDHAAWMITDSTGVPPSVARANGFEQITYGNFTAAILKVPADRLEEMRELWKSQPKRKLGFRFGYPNHGSGEGHLMVTRPAAR